MALSKLSSSPTFYEFRKALTASQNLWYHVAYAGLGHAPKKISDTRWEWRGRVIDLPGGADRYIVYVYFRFLAWCDRTGRTAGPFDA